MYLVCTIVCDAVEEIRVDPPLQEFTRIVYSSLIVNNLTVVLKVLPSEFLQIYHRTVTQWELFSISRVHSRLYVYAIKVYQHASLRPYRIHV